MSVIKLLCVAIIMLCLNGCGEPGPWSSLDIIEHDKKDCADYKKRFEFVVVPNPPPPPVQKKIEDCKALGAW